MKKLVKRLFILVMSLVPFTLQAADLSANTNVQQMSQSDSNKLVGQAFLAKNMSLPGVVTLPDGLQYKVIKQGNGPRPNKTDIVTVNYAGKLLNGKEFDSSYKRKEPAKFPLNQVIPGWTEALSRMNQGSTWEIYIPASLAYGEEGMPPVIGPNETLIFKVELLNIDKV